MPEWNLRFQYDHSDDPPIDLETVKAEGPDEAMAKVFNSKWEQVDTTTDGVLVCYHYRMKDAHVTVYVWED